MYTMSKAVGTFVEKASRISNASSKFTATAAAGSRIIPSVSKDAEFQMRIDAGHYDAATKKLNVVLQVNKEAKSPGLRNWARSNSTHGKLATATFDTGASDKQAEFNKMLSVLRTKAKENLEKK